MKGLTLDDPANNDVLPEAVESDGSVLVETPDMDDTVFIQMPASDRVVLADVPVTVYEDVGIGETLISDAQIAVSVDPSVAKATASIDAVFAEASANVATNINEAASELAFSVPNPTQAFTLPLPLVGPQALTSYTTDRTTKTSSSESVRLSGSPEFTLSGNVEVDVIEAPKRDYFSEELQASDKIDPEIFDSFFQQKASSDFEFGTFR